MPLARTARLTSLIWLLAAAPVFADQALDSELLKQLGCAATPDPTPALLALQQAGMIDVASGTKRDSSTCWELQPALELMDASFDHVCASSEDPAAVAKYPDFYFRGPGTSAGNELALVTTLDAVFTQQWAQKNLPGDQPAYSVGDSARVEGETEISCVGILN